jgi:hypothetical protein
MFQRIHLTGDSKGCNSVAKTRSKLLDNISDAITVHFCFVLIATSDGFSYKNSQVRIARTNLRVNKVESGMSSCNTTDKTPAHNEQKFLCRPKDTTH